MSKDRRRTYKIDNEFEVNSFIGTSDDYYLAFSSDGINWNNNARLHINNVDYTPGSFVIAHEKDYDVIIYSIYYNNCVSYYRIPLDDAVVNWIKNPGTNEYLDSKVSSISTKTLLGSISFYTSEDGYSPYFERATISYSDDGFCLMLPIDDMYGALLTYRMDSQTNLGYIFGNYVVDNEYYDEESYSINGFYTAIYYETDRYCYYSLSNVSTTYYPSINGYYICYGDTFSTTFSELMSNAGTVYNTYKSWSLITLDNKPYLVSIIYNGSSSYELKLGGIYPVSEISSKFDLSESITELSGTYKFIGTDVMSNVIFLGNSSSEITHYAKFTGSESNLTAISLTSTVKSSSFRNLTEDLVIVGGSYNYLLDTKNNSVSSLSCTNTNRSIDSTKCYSSRVKF